MSCKKRKIQHRPCRWKGGWMCFNCGRRWKNYPSNVDPRKVKA